MCEAGQFTLSLQGLHPWAWMVCCHQLPFWGSHHLAGQRRLNKVTWGTESVS